MSVGTSPGADDVVSNGVVQPAFVSGAAVAAFDGAALYTSFYATLTAGANATMFAATAISDVAAVTLSLSDALARNGSVLCVGCVPAGLSVLFHCQAVGETQVTLRLPMQGYNPIQFGFRKQCAGTFGHLFILYG